LELVQCLASLMTGLVRAAGQLALAYVTAKTHGLEEEAARVAEAIGEGHLPQVWACSAPCCVSHVAALIMFLAACQVQ
jgi:hypothetical protein